MMDEAKLLNDPNVAAELARQFQMTTAERLYANAQRLQGERNPLERELTRITYETVAQQLLILGVRSEFLVTGLPLEKSQLKNIQRCLQRRGLLDGILHAKRLLENEDRSAKYFLSKGRIVVALFWLIYEQLQPKTKTDSLHLYDFVLAYLLAKEIFEHPQIAPLELPSMPVDLAYYFAYLMAQGRGRLVVCSQCGLVYPVFDFESADLIEPACPYCHLLAVAHLNDLKAALNPTLEP